jgi:RNA polymerase sigma-70 factor, ECF subfamily
VERPDARAWTGTRPRQADVGRSASRDPDRATIAWSSTISDQPGVIAQPSGDADERVIVDAVLAGDRDAFRRLVERESASVIRACQRVLGDHAEAEDAAQEAFVTAYRSLASWRADGPFGAWLTRIAVRIALRQAGKRRTVAWRDPGRGRLEDGAPSAADRAVEQASISASSWTDPAVLSMRSERATEIRRAVTALPEPYREVVALRFFGEATLDEIARQTGRPLGTVKTHLHRGLARLRTDMEGRER